MRVVFWQNMVNLSQATLVRALASMDGFEVAWIVEHEGGRSYWNIAGIGETTLITAPSPAVVRELLAQRESDSLHVFSMHHHPRGLPILYGAFKRCTETQAKMALLGEGTAWGGFRSWLRWALDAYTRLRRQDRIGFILAQGMRAEPWFRRCGYPAARIFPFGFFADSLDSNATALPEENPETFEMIFIGHCIARKGLDILLSALADLGQIDWRLTIIGDGERRAELESLSRRLGLSERVSFLGALPNAQARACLSRADLLVLPSRYDSWGVVVNEALLSGVPVVCSNMCGAKVLLGRPERGDVFDHRDPGALRLVLARRIQMGKRSPELAAGLKEWSRVIQGKSIARYFADIVDWAYFGGARPIPPWEEGPQPDAK